MPLSVVSLEKDNAVSVRVRILNWPLIPSIPAPVKFNKVSLLEKLQLTFELCGSEGSHLVAPSFTSYSLVVLKIVWLSFSHASMAANDGFVCQAPPELTSMLLYNHGFCVNNSILDEELLFFLQEAIDSNTKIPTDNLRTVFFINAEI